MGRGECGFYSLPAEFPILSQITRSNLFLIKILYLRFVNLEEYELGIWPMNKQDVVEVDSLYELAELDKNYLVYLEES